MNRAHKVFICTIAYDAEEFHANPDAPGSGEMTRTGRTLRTQRTVIVAAPDVRYVDAWLRENPYRYPGVELKVVEEHKLDAVIELHTY